MRGVISRTGVTFMITITQTPVHRAKKRPIFLKIQIFTSNVRYDDSKALKESGSLSYFPWLLSVDDTRYL